MSGDYDMPQVMFQAVDEQSRYFGLYAWLHQNE